MKKQQTPAQTMYEAAVESLQKFCEKETEVMPNILDDGYPVRVQFIPKPQLSVFGNENVDENGEFNDLTVTVGLTTDVKSTLKFKMDSKLLKKLIGKAETVGSLYYHAFREEQGERITPTRPDYEGDGYADGHLVYDTAYCPNCRHGFEEGANDWSSAFCPDCGQALDWTPEPEPDAFEEGLEKLRRTLSETEGEQ